MSGLNTENAFCAVPTICNWSVALFVSYFLFHWSTMSLVYLLWTHLTASCNNSLFNSNPTEYLQLWVSHTSRSVSRSEGGITYSSSPHPYILWAGGGQGVAGDLSYILQKESWGPFAKSNFCVTLVIWNFSQQQLSHTSDLYKDNKFDCQCQRGVQLNV